MPQKVLLPEKKSTFQKKNQQLENGAMDRGMDTNGSGSIIILLFADNGTTMTDSDRLLLARSS